MAPLRRYLRITKYSVLECRIYLDDPSLAQSWLLSPRDPVLPRVIEAVRPFVLPKLREERERSRKKSAKKRSIKDTVTQDDFEVSIFLTETNIRHSLLYKHKHFRDTTQTRLTSNTSKLTGASREAPIDVDVSGIPMLREEDDDDDVVALHDIPILPQDETTAAAAPRQGDADVPGSDEFEEDHDDDDVDDLFIAQDEDEDQHEGDDTAPPPAKRLRDGANALEHEGGRDDKKKLAMDISYEGFSIYGRVLCLVVKRREGIGSKGKGIATAGGRGKAGQSTPAPGGQAVMENWITSTQIPDAAVSALSDAL
ncbi:hypothetical protein M406DRAFT_43792 [Cryphonectria parasitica EP155]|uniref:Uncharacterized protein n=1 Tax=Cryphonectria parasitica (strain ATCC 38755 / EP155) TaxID=660469 RepID=A0A9P4Y166_CRYP1|nr:uncharacterized protein M406DRAFT_43792 [Cryphonectria parasitica EP155]KAF3764603.1 hypothetical protein M406DRAFT_43792 [Cryphonectria parasitica EP155]